MAYGGEIKIILFFMDRNSGRKIDNRTVQARLFQRTKTEWENPFAKKTAPDRKGRAGDCSLQLLGKETLVVRGKEWCNLSLPSPSAVPQDGPRKNCYLSIKFYSENLHQRKRPNQSLLIKTASLYINKKPLTPFTEGQKLFNNRAANSFQSTAPKINKYKVKQKQQNCHIVKDIREAIPLFRKKLKLKIASSNNRARNKSCQLITGSRQRNCIEPQSLKDSFQPKRLRLATSTEPFKPSEKNKSRPYVAALQKLKAHQTAVEIKRGIEIYQFQSRINKLGFSRYQAIHSSAKSLKYEKTLILKTQGQKLEGELKRTNSLNDVVMKRGLICMGQRRKGIVLKVDSRYEHGARIKQTVENVLEKVAQSYFFGKEIMERLQRVNIQSRNLQSAMESDCILYRSTQKHAAARESRQSQGQRRIELQHARRIESLKSKQLKLDGNAGRVARITTLKQFQ